MFKCRRDGAWEWLGGGGLSPLEIGIRKVCYPEEFGSCVGHLVFIFFLYRLESRFVDPSIVIIWAFWICLESLFVDPSRIEGNFG